MRPIYWLQISDIHLRAGNEWSQDFVLKAMCKNIREQRAAGIAADFVLMTGDIAFSGKTQEYKLAANFFDALQTASGVPKKRIFCVAGNHDIDRERQKLCFRGARTELQGPSQVDALLAGGEDLQTLLLRQENYRQFQRSYFIDQKRISTADGLGYVSRFAIDEIQLAIVGLDSAWLAEGGIDDNSKLLIGERQVVNALNLTTGDIPPHIILGMAHHPLHLLQEFDRRFVQKRLEDALHFFHCGHLHESETRIAGSTNSSCLTVVAGASFESRQNSNTYSIVKLDLLSAVRKVKVIRYNPANGNFSTHDSNEYQFELAPIGMCKVKELADEIHIKYPILKPLAYYLAALVLGKKTDLLIPNQVDHIFGSFEVIQNFSKSDLKCKTVKFMKFRNVLRVLYNSQPLNEILNRHGDLIRQYGEALMRERGTDAVLQDRLKKYDEDARRLAKTEPQEKISHTHSLFDELVNDQDWTLLRNQAERHLDSADPSVAIQSKRMLAFALANSDETTDKREAIKHYQSLTGSESIEFSDFGNLATLLADEGRMDDAHDIVINGFKTFPEKNNYFSEIGQKIVIKTGNRHFRKRIEKAQGEEL